MRKPFNPKLNPTLDLLLQDQRESLTKRLPEHISTSELVEINSGLVWHAVFTLCATSTLDMQKLADLTRDAVQKGIEHRQKQGK